MNMLGQRWAKISESSFIRSIVVLAGGTVIAQLITILALPVITRVYSPTDFGVLAAYVAIVQLITAGASMRLEIAIPLPSLDEDAANVFAIAAASVVIISAIASTVIFLLPSFGMESHIYQELYIYRWFVPFGILFSGIYTALQFWSIRKKNYKSIARSRVSQSLATAGVQLSMGFAKFAATGLMVGQLAQYVLGTFTLAKKALSEDFYLIKKVNIKDMRTQWNKYQSFPKYSVAEVVAQTAGVQLPVIIIASIAVGPEAGFLSLAMKAMQAPMSLIGMAIAQVFTGTAAEAFRDQRLGNLTVRTVGGLLKSAVGPMIFIGILAPQIFRLAFGSEWERTGDLVRWLTPLLVLQMLALPLGTTFYVSGNQILALKLQLLGALMRVGLVFLVAQVSSRWVSESYAISGGLFYLLYLAAVLRCASASAKSLLLEIKKASPYVLAWGAGGVALSYLN